MQTKRERLALLLLFVVLLLGAAFASGCQEADETDTTQPATETTGVATDTTAPDGATATTGAPDGGTTTTEAGSTDTSEGLAEVSEQFKVCTDCHSDFNQFLNDPEQKVLTKNFAHGLHLNKGYKCEDCHIVPTHQPDQIVVPPMQKCFTCHGQETDAVAPGACGTCHPQDFALVPGNHGQAGWLPPEQVSLVKTVNAKHSDMASEDRAYCQMCHAEKFCSDCHQTAMPHPDDWQAAHPQQVKSGGDQGCQRCHPQKYLCNDCHHTGFKPGEVGWRNQHPPIVQSQGAENCFKCHNPLTCARCHVRGVFEEVESPSGG